MKNLVLALSLLFICIYSFSQGININHDVNGKTDYVLYDHDTVILEDRFLMYEVDTEPERPVSWIKTGNIMNDLLKLHIQKLKTLKQYYSGTDYALREFRGAWIPTIYNLDWPDSRYASTADQKQQMINLFDKLHNAGINAVVFQVRAECDALYDSPYEPWSYWLTGEQGKAPNPYYDPLEFAVEEAHKRGMEIHAWFNPYRALRSSGDPNSLASNHVVNQNPDWVITFSNGLKILDPGLPQVREFVTKIVSDVVRRYDIDAIHFDDYFYPYNPGISTQDAETFAQYPRGFTDIGDWRRDNVNLLIENVYDSINLIKPHVIFGISPFGIWKNGVPDGISGLDAYNVIYADAVSWMQNEIIDYLTPQLYWAFGGGQDYATLAPWWESVRNNRRLYIGHGSYKSDSQTWGGTLFNESEIPLQIRFNRQHNGIEGGVFYRAKNITHFHSQGFEDTLKNNLYKYPAIIPSFQWKNVLYAPLSPPSNLSYYWEDEQTVELQWDAPPPPAYGDDLIRYAVYRINSSTSPVFPDDINNPENLISIQPTTTFTDTPPYSVDPYFYFVTALNRNHNQSEPSNIVNTSGTDVLAVTTNQVTSISYTTAVSGGNVIDDGGSAVTSKGVVWSTSANPTVEVHEGITNDGAGLGSFTSNLTGLIPGTLYYVRAYAINNEITAYGNQVSFVTLSTVQTETITITYGSTGCENSNNTNVYPFNIHNSENRYNAYEAIYLQEEIDKIGYITSIAYHKTSGTNTNITNVEIWMRHTSISNLATGTTSQAGYTKVFDGSFTNNASSGWMKVDLDDKFYYNNEDNLQVMLIKKSNAIMATPPQWSYTAIYDNPPTCSNWSRRARQYNSTSNTFLWTNSLTETGWRSHVQFDIEDIIEEFPPSVETTPITEVTTTTATSGGNVINDGGATVTARGVVWSTSQNPTVQTNLGITSNGTGIGNFTSNLSELDPGTNYYLRAYATNSEGTAYGQQLSFTTNLPDYNVYVELSNHYDVYTNNTITVVMSVNGLPEGMHPLGIQGSIMFNLEILEYLGYVGYQLEGSSLTVSEVDGQPDTKTILWSTDYGSSTVTNGDLLGLQFKYKGIGEICTDIIWTGNPLAEMIIDDNWNEIEALWNNSEICGADGGYTVSGKVKYAGRVNVTPDEPTYNNPIYNLDSVIVILKTPMEIEINRDTTNNEGMFTINYIPNEGDYILEYHKLNNDYNKWIHSGTGINAADVGMLRTHILNPGDARFKFDDFYLNAMDFNDDGSLNAADVSMLQTKIVNPFNPDLIDMQNFLPLGTWMSGSDQITINSNITNYQCVLIAYGDYNASATAYLYNDFSTHNWNSGKYDKTDDFIIETENILIVEENTFILPVYVQTDYENISGYQLELSYPSDKFMLISANINIDDSLIDNDINIGISEIINSEQDFLVTDINGVIRILYVSQPYSSFDISSDEIFLNLEFETIDNEQTVDDFYLTGHTSLVSTSNFDVISPVNIEIPKLTDGTSLITDSELFKLQVYPNPANDIIYVQFDVYKIGLAEISLIDVLGREVKKLENINLIKGQNKFEFNVSDLTSGLYTVKINYNNETTNEIINVKMIVN